MNLYRITLIFIVFCIFKVNAEKTTNEIIFYNGGSKFIFYLSGKKIDYLEFNTEDSKITKKIKNRIYNVDIYSLDKSSLNKYLVNDKILINNGQLFYSGKKVYLDNGIQMRAFYKTAICWHNYVILLGRTSITDPYTKYNPPVFSTEIIYFSLDDYKATCLSADFVVPGGYNGLFIVQSHN